MKKLFLTVLAAAVLLTSTASAASFTSLGKLQHFLLSVTPDQLLLSAPSVELEGTVLEIIRHGSGNHWDLLLAVEDDNAIPPVGESGPRVLVHFRLHREAPPWQIGDVITVSGSLNAMYSSVIIPSILADLINGTDDF